MQGFIDKRSCCSDEQSVLQVTSGCLRGVRRSELGSVPPNSVLLECQQHSNCNFPYYETVMVGVPRSKGCSTCRLRSIKCDEARPSCAQCRRGGRKCPGYQVRSKFVDESVKFSKACLKDSTSSIPEGNHSQAISIKDNTPRPRDASFADRNATTLEPVRFNSTTSRSGSSDSNADTSGKLRLTGFLPDLRRLERWGLVASFIQDLFPLGRSTVQHSFIGSWLWHVPECLHRNPAMDFAAESLAVAYFAKKTSSTEVLIRSRNTYTYALRNLSKALQNHRSRFSSETLCATLLLVHFENFVGMRGKSWVTLTHAGGTGGLIQLRGPDRHRTGFDYAMFMASRGYLISQAVETGTGCFLDDDKWRSIDLNDESAPLMPDNSAIFHEGLNHFASIPGLIEKFKRLSDDDSSIDYAFMHHEAKKVRSNMIQWIEKLQSDSRLPTRILLPFPYEPEMIFPSRYEYRDIITAAFVVNYSAYLLQVNNMLDAMERSQNHIEESISLSHDICMSAAYCLRAGFCGLQAMAFALPLAISALPECYTSWIQRQMHIFEIARDSTTLQSAIFDDLGVAVS